MLDLVFTSEPDMIDSVSVLGSLGNSDHNILLWSLQLYTTTRCFDRPTLDYSKADFCAMRQALSEVDWSHALQGDTNSQWTFLVSIMKSLEKVWNLGIMVTLQELGTRYYIAPE